MKSRILRAAISTAFFLGLTGQALAQAGKPYIHDPSTIMQCDGKYYTFGTGGGGLISDDGWIWHSGAVRPGGGVAPNFHSTPPRGHGALRRSSNTLQLLNPV